jgi:hypothetical protein
MKKRVLSALLLCAFWGLGSTATAEMPAAPAASETRIDPAAVAEARNLFKSMGLSKIYKQIVDQATEGLVKRQPALARIKTEIRDFYAKYIGWDAIKEDLARVYAKYFTPRELKDLEAFYSTPTGRKALRLTPQIMAEGRRIGMEKVIAHRDELKKLVMKALQKQQPAQKPAAK